MALLGLLGVLDSLYLTVEHYRGKSVICLTGAGCDAVLQSSYATIAGILPVAMLGLAYYLAVFFLSSYAALHRFELARYAAARIPIVGFMASVWFVYLQVFQIRAICAWCMVSAVLSVVLLAIGLSIIFREGGDNG